MFSLIPVINVPGQQSVPLALPFGRQNEFSASRNSDCESNPKDIVIKPDDTPFFSGARKNSDGINVTKSANINSSSYKPYGTYEPLQHQNKTPYPLYGWSFPPSYQQEQQSQNQRDKSDITIEDVEDFENEAIAEMENLEIEPDKEILFQLKFNFQGFALKDIKLQRNGDQLLIEGKQKAKTTVGAFFRTFTYIINLPENIETSQLIAYLNHNGILYISKQN